MPSTLCSHTSTLLCLLQALMWLLCLLQLLQDAWPPCAHAPSCATSRLGQKGQNPSGHHRPTGHHVPHHDPRRDFHDLCSVTFSSLVPVYLSLSPILSHMMGHTTCFPLLCLAILDLLHTSGISLPLSFSHPPSIPRHMMGYTTCCPIFQVLSCRLTPAHCFFLMPHCMASVHQSMLPSHLCLHSPWNRLPQFHPDCACAGCTTLVPLSCLSCSFATSTSLSIDT
jgi:hypothetical protein